MNFQLPQFSKLTFVLAVRGLDAKDQGIVLRFHWFVKSP